MTRAQSIVVSAVLAVVTAVLLVIFVLRLSRTDGAEVNLSPRIFEVGRADRLSKQITKDGPFLFKDPLTAGQGRELWLQHLGGDENEGWLAFEARIDGATERCITRWDNDDREFTDPCSKEIYPEDGEGLEQYKAGVDDKTGLVVVDLRPAAEDDAGTTSTTTP